MELPETTEENLAYFHGEIMALRRISAIALTHSLRSLRGTPEYQELLKEINNVPEALDAGFLAMKNGDFVRLGFRSCFDHLQKFLDA